MECSSCHRLRLAAEFPSRTKCEHFHSVCIECCDGAVSGSDSCPLLLAENKEVIRSQLRAFRTAVDGDTTTASPSQITRVRLLDGTVMLIRGLYTAANIRDRVARRTNRLQNMVRLVHNGVELESSQNVPFGSQLHACVLLLARCDPDAVLLFDLSWDHPLKDPQYLDATCMIFCDDQKQSSDCVNFTRKTSSLCPGVKFEAGSRGDSHQNQQIKVELGSIPKEVSRLYFILSTFPKLEADSQGWVKRTQIMDPNLYKNPRLNLTDVTTGESLVKYPIDAKSAACVVVCLLSRAPKSTCWEVSEIGRPSQGHAEDLAGVKKTIETLEKELK